MKILTGHTNPDNAYVVDDYPYGFRVRTKIRYWIETRPKMGQRFCHQTLNPKTGKWNKPKCSTYSPVILLGLDNNNHVVRVDIPHSTQDFPSFRDFYNKYGQFLDEWQKKEFALKYTYAQVYDELKNEDFPDWREKHIKALILTAERLKKNESSLFDTPGNSTGES